MRSTSRRRSRGAGGNHRGEADLGDVTDDVEAVVAATFRTEWGSVVASLIRYTGDWDLAEECAQDAFGAALERWRRDGLPRNPGAWISTVARNRAVDRLRRRTTEREKYEQLSVTDSDWHATSGEQSGIADDRLRLLFTCCHPALALEAQVALTLRTLAGLTTGEITRAFLIQEETMAKRLVRAKAKIRHAAIPFRIPPDHLLAERLTAVLGVLYLLFNEGYAATEGSELVRVDLAAEAIRLSRLLVDLMPDEPEALGVAALMLLQHSRRRARVDRSGELVPLEEQDRSSWDRGEITDGLVFLERALRRGLPGPYQVQAAIAACHATASTAEATDWYEIAALYAVLAEMVPSSVVELNRAVAVGMAEGPAAGLDRLERLDVDPTLSAYHLVPATRADLLRRLGRHDEAAAAYREAIAMVRTEAERRYLERRLVEVSPA